MSTVSHDMSLRLILPRWARRLTARLRSSDDAFVDMERYMQEIIDAREAEAEETNTKGGRFDLLSLLLEANRGEGEDAVRLTNSELLGESCVSMLDS